MTNSSSNQNFFERFVDKNSWGLLIAAIALVAFYTTTNIKVQALEYKIATLENLVQRVIVLEEQNKHEEQVLNDIKTDTKDIKKSLQEHINQSARDFTNR